MLKSKEKKKTKIVKPKYIIKITFILIDMLKQIKRFYLIKYNENKLNIIKLAK